MCVCDVGSRGVMNGFRSQTRNHQNHKYKLVVANNHIIKITRRIRT